MARKKQSGAEDVIELTSKFPWWMGTILAIGSYVWLHSVASKGLPQAPAGDLSAAIKGSLFFTFASFGQYVFPALFGFGAVLSLVMTFKRKKIYNDVSSGERKVSDISWQKFEILIGEHFRRKGYQVTETADGADGGVDLVLRKDGEKCLVQCKHWRAYKVGVKPVRELLGVMASKSASGGIVVASGEFTADAKRFARENNIQLVDGRILKQIIANSKRVTNQRTKSTVFRTEDNSGVKAQPACPKCGGDMVVRTAKRGHHAGQKFWGCTQYPKCRGILPVEKR